MCCTTLTLGGIGYLLRDQLIVVMPVGDQGLWAHTTIKGKPNLASTGFSPLHTE